jgi:hypothetical protein
MPYELQTDAILAGSLNLLAPGERGGETDALALHNWRIDQGGQLRSRLGTGTAIAAPGGYLHSIGRVEHTFGPTRYYGSDTNLYRGANPVAIATGFDGNPLGMVSFQNKLWVMNRLKQGKDDASNYFNWTPAKPTVAPTFTAGGGGTGGLNGDYDYYVTFTAGISGGEETNPSPVLAVTGLAANDSVIITRPASTDPQVSGWNIYRSGGAFSSQRYRVNVLPVAIATTTYGDSGLAIDDQSDDDIAGAGIILEVDHDAAPAARTIAGPYLGRILAFGTAANPNRMFWTEANAPAFFPGSADSDEGNWADIGEEGEEFIGAAVFPQVLLIIKGKSIWRLIGDPADAGSQIERLNVDIGGIGLKAFAVSGATVYLQGQEGIYRTSVSATALVSPVLMPIFKGDTIEGYGAIPTASLSTSAAVRAKHCMAIVNGRLYFSVATGANTIPNITLVFNELTGQWASDSRGFTALFYEGQGDSLLGAIAGIVYPAEQGYQDAGSAIAPTFQTRFRTQGAPNVRKHYANFEIQHRLNGATYTVYAVYDNDGSTLQSLGTISSAATSEWSLLTIPDPAEGSEPRSIAIRLEQLSAGTSYAEVLTMAVRWYPVPLDGVIFDSGNIKLAGGQVCLLQNLELDVENTGGGTVTYDWQSDLPGNVVQSRSAGTVTGTGVGSFRKALGVKEARWARLIVRSTAAGCRVRGARVQVRPIGLYLQGAGDDYQTAELNAGSPRLKLFSRIRISAQADGAIPLGLLTDVPAASDSLASVATGSIPATADRQWYEKRLPSTIRGKLYRLALTSSAIGRVFEILVRCKVLGESPSAWQWVPVPITRTPDEWAWLEIPIA